MLLLRLLALLSVVLLTGCLPSALSSGSCPSGVDPLEDMVSFLQHDGVQYDQNWPLTPVPEDQLGRVVGTGR